MFCEDIKRLNDKGDYKGALNLLRNRAQDYEQEVTFPDLFILVCEGCVSNKLDKKEILPVLMSLRENNVLTQGVRERVRGLEKYSKLKEQGLPLPIQNIFNPYKY